MKKLIRWTATYETIIEVPDGSSELDIKDEAAGIVIAVAGSEYQTDTWEVEAIADTKSDEVREIPVSLEGFTPEQ